MIDERPKTFLNLIKAHATDVNHYVVPFDNTHTLILASYLNSTITAFMVELYGRSYGGGISKLQVYELNNLPVLDPSALSESERDRIALAFKRLAEAVDKRVKAEEELNIVKSKSKKERGLFEDKMQRRLEDAIKEESKARKELDEAVYDTLGLSKAERVQVEKALAELQEIRRLRSRA